MLDKFVDALKKSNRALLEMFSGMLLIGVIAEIVGLFIVEDKGLYSAGLWLGIAMAAGYTFHMKISLDKALDFESQKASTMVMSNYLIRYFVVAAIMILICYTKVINPLLVFFSFLSMKVSAFLQPLTHKFYNFLFHETDPIPQPLEDEEIVEEKRVGGDD